MEKELLGKEKAFLIETWGKLLDQEDISIDQDFFELGGDSLLALQMINDVKAKLKLELPIRDFFTNPTIRGISKSLRELDGSLSLSVIEPGARPERIPLSYSQESIWIIDQVEGSVQYHVPWILGIHGNLDVEGLSKSFGSLISRHEILRTVYKEYDGVPVQEVLPASDWEMIRISGNDFSSDERGLRQFTGALISEPFDLSTDYPIRAHLIDLGSEHYTLVVLLHHIASDGWSWPIIVRELSTLYNNYSQGLSEGLTPLKIQYADFALWQRDHLKGEALARRLSYWQMKLKDLRPLNLVTDYSRPAIPSSQGSVVHFTIPVLLREKLELLAHKHEVTMFMLMLSAFKVLLYRYSGQGNICVGVPVANRSQHELDGLVGYFVNTVALLSGLEGALTFSEVLKGVKESTLEAYEYQDVPFEKVVEAVAKGRDLSYHPIFQVMFELQSGELIDGTSVLSLDGLEVREGVFGHSTSKFDITLSIMHAAGSMRGSLEYRTDLFRSDRIERMSGHYIELLTSIVGEPSSLISRLNILPDSERDLLRSFNNNFRAFDRGKTFLDFLASRVRESPGTIAVIHKEEKIAYSKLWSRSNQIARALSGRGITTGDIVPVYMHRGIDLIVGIIGIWKSGAAYLPIDPFYPEARITYMINDSQSKVLLTKESLIADLALPGGCGLLLCDGEEVSGQSEATPVLELTNEDLAYVIYTSGSTGEPKGVMIEHLGMLNHLQSTIDTFELGSTSVVAQNSSQGFDISVWQMFSALQLGGTVVVYGKDQIEQVDSFIDSLQADNVDVLEVVPSYLSLMLDSAGDKKLAALKFIIVTGEQATPSIVERWFTTFPGIKLINAYGPAEASDDVTYYEMESYDGEPAIPIGRPIANLSVYIVDAHLELCPIGVPGQICIGGIGVGRGYLNRPGKTEELFREDPFQAGQRFYQSGDIGLYRPDGNIEFLGRKDDQVKIRGHRVELGEVEWVLNRSDGIEQGVVTCRSDERGHNHLVGHIVVSSGYDGEVLRRHMGSHLPQHMIPSQWQVLDSLPLTANGKIDRKGLGEMSLEGVSTGHYVAPRSLLEEQLAELWQEVLHVSRVGIYDNFFELGGDSIITIQVVSRMHRLGYDFKPRDIFLKQTIAELATSIEESRKLQTKSEQGRLTGHCGLIPIQHLFFETDSKTVSHYNQDMIIGVSKDVDSRDIFECFDKIIEQHDALSFRYHNNGEAWEQTYSSSNYLMEEIDLTGQSLADFHTSISVYGTQAHQQLSIEEGCLVKVIYFKSPEEESLDRLLIIIHHLVVDGVSWRILISDLEYLLSLKKENRPLDLGPKSDSFRQWYQKLIFYSEQKSLLSQQDYWEGVVRKSSPLPVDRDDASKVYFKDVDHLVDRLSKRGTEILLKQVSKVYQTEINDLLLAALVQTLSTWSNRSGIIIGLEGHGREDVVSDIDISRTVGWFTTIYPVLLTSPGDDYSSLIKSVKEQLRQVPGKGIGYGILRYLNKVPSLQNSCPWEIVFNYLGQFDNLFTQSKWFSEVEEDHGIPVALNRRVQKKLEVNPVVQDGELVCYWSYSKKHYDHSTIKHLAEEYIGALEQIIGHCTQWLGKTTFRTPSDYGLEKHISYTQLDDFLGPDEPGLMRKESIEDIYRLSGLQEGMLFHSLYDDSVGAYYEQFSCDLKGVDISIFESSWSYLLQSYSILRTSFHFDEFDVPVQCVHRHVSLPIELLDYSDLDDEGKSESLGSLQESDLAKGFDFTVAPLMRITLVKVGRDVYRMIWTSHHMLLDGWSVPIVISNLLTVYDTLLKGGQPKLGQDYFGDYIRYLGNHNKYEEEEYWRDYLAGLAGGSQLPFVSRTTEATKGIGEYQHKVLNLNSDLTSEIKYYAKSNKITVNTLIQGVWSYLLHRYTNRSKVVYGVTVSGRPEDLRGVEMRVGMYINTIPFVTEIKDEELVSEWLQGIQNRESKSRQYQHSSLADTIKWSEVKGELFDNILVFENYPVSDVLENAGSSLQLDKYQVHEQTNYPLDVTIMVGHDTLISFNYNRDLIEPSYISQMLGHFEHVLKQFIRKKKLRMEDVELLTDQERSQLLEKSRGLEVDYPRMETVVSLFEAQAARVPESVAVVFEQQEMTYSELSARSNQLANYLISSGVQAEELIPLCLERGFEMIVGILGILKAGCAYVPIDPTYPKDRIRYFFSDTGAARVVTNAMSKENIPAGQGIETLEIDLNAELYEKQSKQLPLVEITPNQLAYVIYTSGSTGKPKGVLVEHKNLVRLFFTDRQLFDFSEQDRWLLHHSFSFDFSVWEIFGALFYGAKLYLLPNGAEKDIIEFSRFINSSKISVLNQTPSAFYVFQDHYLEIIDQSYLRYIIFGGESLNPTRLRPMISTHPQCKLINMYGITETTVHVTYEEITLEHTESSASIIGRAIPTLKTIILDNKGRLVPPGVPGELYVSGDGLARGYLNMDELTSNKFITYQNRIHYKSGDICTSMIDGRLVYHARIDHQVQIRGFRVELAEVETRILQYSKVKQVVVLANKQDGIHQSMTAFLVVHSSFNDQSLRANLKKVLPHYMIPSKFVVLSSLPETKNGKIDREELLSYRSKREVNFDNEVVKNSIEHRLLIIWKELLELNSISVQDDFFLIGGHSLLAMRLVTIIKSRFGVSIPIKSLFMNRTIEDLSMVIRMLTVEVNKEQNGEYEVFEL